MKRKLMKSIAFNLEARNTPFGGFKGGLSTTFKSEVPAAYGRSDRINGPRFDYRPDGSVRIINREYIGDILATTNIYEIVETFIANPLSRTTFPWLSSIAQAFEKFCFEKLCFSFCTQSPTSSPGSVMIVPVYNADQEPPGTKLDALSLKDCVRGPAWEDCCANLPRERLCNYKEYYTRINPSDKKLSIPADVYFCTSGGSDSSPITGEAWVEYDINLTCPMKQNFGCDCFQVLVVDSGEIFQTPPDMTSVVPPLTNQLPLTQATYASDGTNNYIVIPPGSYTIWLEVMSFSPSGRLNVSQGSAINVDNIITQNIAGDGVRQFIFWQLIVRSDTIGNRTMQIEVLDSSSNTVTLQEVNVQLTQFS